MAPASAFESSASLPRTSPPSWRVRKLRSFVTKTLPVWQPGARFARTDRLAGRRRPGHRLDDGGPGLILYATAVVLESGEVRFFDGYYGQEAQLVKREKTLPAADAAHVHVNKVGHRIISHAASAQRQG